MKSRGGALECSYLATTCGKPVLHSHDRACYPLYQNHACTCLVYCVLQACVDSVAATNFSSTHSCDVLMLQYPIQAIWQSNIAKNELHMCIIFSPVHSRSVFDSISENDYKVIVSFSLQNATYLALCLTYVIDPKKSHSKIHNIEKDTEWLKRARKWQINKMYYLYVLPCIVYINFCSFQDK